MSTPLSKRGYLKSLRNPSTKYAVERKTNYFKQRIILTVPAEIESLKLIILLLCVLLEREINLFDTQNEIGFVKKIFSKIQNRSKLGISRYISYLELLLTMSVLNRLLGVTSLPKSSKTYKRNNNKTIKVKTLKISL